MLGNAFHNFAYGLFGGKNQIDPGLSNIINAIALKASGTIKNSDDNIKDMFKGYTDQLNTKQIELISNKIKELDQSNQLATMSATELGEALTQSVGGASGILTKVVGSIKAMVPQILANLAIMAVIAGISKIYKTLDERQQKAIEAGEEATKKIKEQRQAYQDNAKYIKQYSDRYTQLSKGINASGDNVSLTTSEFEELQNIQNDLANRFPELVAGYDEFGNAILKAGTNAQTLTEALREQKDEMYESTIASSKDVIAGFKEQSKFDGGLFEDVQSGGMYKASKDMYEALMSGNNWVFAYNGVGQEEDQTLIDTMNLEVAAWNNNLVTFAELQKHASEIISMYKQYKTEVNEITDSMREVSQAYLNMNDSFKYFSSEQQSIMSTAIDSLSFEFFDEKSFDNGAEVDQWITQVVDTIEANQLHDEFEQVFTLDPSSITKNNVESIKSSISMVGQALGMTQDSEAFKEFYKNFEIDEKQLGASYKSALDNVDAVFKEHDIYNNSRYLGTVEMASAIQAAQEYTDLLKEAKNLGYDENQTIFGNIDTNNRQILEWTEENINLYRDSVWSWGTSLKELEGSYSTVFGTLGNYDGIDIAFSPMLQTENGAKLLSSDTVDQYIYSLIESLGEGWTKEDLLALDAEGIEIDGQHIKGLIADIGETAEKTSQAMHFAGKDGALATAFAHLEEQAKNAEVSVEDFLKSANKQELENWLQTLTTRELDIFATLHLNGTETIDDIQKMIDEGIFQVKSLSEFEIETTNMLAGYDLIATAMSELNKSAKMSDETFSGLKTAFGDLDNVLVRTSNGIVMNTTAMAELQDQAAETLLLELEMKEAEVVKNYQQKAAQLKSYTDQHKGLAEALATGELEKYANAVEGTTDALTDSELAIISNLHNTTSALANEIDGYDQLELQIRSATSALNQWIIAKETANEKDNAATAASGIKEAEELMKNGWYAQDDLTQFIDYVGSYEQSDENYTPEKEQEYITRAKRYLTVDDSGNLTSEGIHRFFNDMQKNHGISLDNFNINEAAMKANMTTDFVTDMLLASMNAGYKLDWNQLTSGMVDGINEIDATSADARTNIEGFREQIDKLAAAGVNVENLEAAWAHMNSEINKSETRTSLDLTTASFAQIQNVALESGEAMKQFFADNGIDFEFNLTGIDSIDEYNSLISQFEKQKLSLNVDSAEYEHVQNIIAYLIAAKRQLLSQQDPLLNIDTSLYTEEMQTALDLLQQYKMASLELEEARSLGLDTTEFETNLQEAQDAITNAGLSDTVKQALNLDLSGTGDEIRNSIESSMRDFSIPINIDELQSFLKPEGETLGVTIEVKNQDALDDVNDGVVDLKTNSPVNASVNVMIAENDVQLLGNAASSVERLEGKENVPVGIDQGITQESIDSVDALASSIGDVHDKEAMVNAIVSGTGQVNALVSAISSLTSKVISISATAHLRTVKEVELLGTAHVQGTALSHFTSLGAYAKGTDWGLPRTETALVNEVGTESIVRGNHWFPIPGGAHLEKLRKGDIVFNAAQTEELIRTGKVISGGGHGRIAYAHGTVTSGLHAYVSPGNEEKTVVTIETPSWMKDTSNYKKGNGSSGSGGSGGNSGGSSGNSGSDSEAEKLDWIERKIKDIERDIENLDQTAQATYKSWSTRNEALVAEMSKVTEEIDIQKKAYDRYMQEAYSVGLSDEYANKVMDGTIDIESIGDEDLRNKISEFQEWYDKAVDCADAVQDLEDNLAELTQQKFDNVMQQFDDLVSTIEHSIEMIEGGIDQLETAGYLVSKQAYEDLRKQQSEHLLTEEKRLAALKIELENAMKSGDIVEGSEAWYEMKQDIYDTESAIQELNTALIETDNNIRQLEWDRFEMTQGRKDRITAESEFLLGLMENEDKFDKDNGRITEYGRASQGLRAVNYNTEMNKVDAYTEMIKDLEKQLAEDPGNQILQEKLDEYVDARYEAVEAAEAEKQAILDTIREGYDKLLDIMSEAAERKNELLQLQKDQLDYEKSIADKTKEVMSLERQLQAYSTDTSEEGIAAAQKIKVRLEEAKYDLESTEMDRYIQETEQLLTILQDDTSEWIDNRMDQEAELLRGVITSTNQNAQTIKETLETEANGVGVKLSDQMAAIWTTGGVAQTVVAEYGVNFGTQLTTTNQVLASIEELVRQWSKIGEEKYEDSKKEPDPVVDTTTPTPPVSNNPPQETDDKSDTKDTSSEITVGSKINAGSARIYANSRGTGGGSQYFGYDPIYTVIGEENGYVRVRWHKASSGSTGWFKKSDVKAYSTGGLIDYDGLAQVHGGKKPELVLNARDTENFIALKDVLQRIDSQDLMFGQDMMLSLQDSMMYMAETMSHQTNLMEKSLVGLSQILHPMDQNVSIQIGDIQMYGVNDPETFATQLKETLKNNVAVKKIIQADTLGVMTGKNTLSKLKYV